MEAAENDEIKRGTRLKQGHTVPLLFKYETLISQLSPSLPLSPSVCFSLSMCTHTFTHGDMGTYRLWEPIRKQVSFLNVQEN